MKKITLWLLALFGCCQMNAQLWLIQECLTVDSTTYGPMYSTASANSTNRTAVVYPASQLAGIAGQTLNAMYFRRAGTTAMLGTPNFKIYMKEVAATDWGTGALDWATAVTGAVLVYDSNPIASVGSSAGWKSFPFSTNFVYSGTQNLAVFYEYTNPVASNAVNWSYEFQGPCVSSANTNTTKYSNNSTGALPASLASTNERRPLIGFDFVVSCPKPTGLILSDVTSNSADLTWTAGGTESQWQYAVVPAGSGIPATFTTIGSNTLTDIPLNPATSYEVYVRAFCGTDDTSLWVSTGSFTTQCVDVTTLFENFDSYPTGTTSMPNCWSKIGTGSAYITTGSILPGSAPNRFYMNTSTTTVIHAITPAFSNLQANTHRLKFKANASVVDRTLHVGYQTNLLDASTFVLLESFALTGTAATAQEFIVTPTGIPAGVKNLVFRNAGVVATSIYIDDVIWEAIPPCPDVTDFAYSNLDDTQVTISWNAAGTETAWQYAYGPSTLNNPSTLTPIDVTVTPTATISPLTPFTAYKFWVRSNCGNGDFGAWIGPLAVLTQCAPVTAFSHNFDTSVTGSANPMADCWDRAGTGSTYITTGSVAPNSPANRLFMSASSTATPPTTAFALMPPVSNLQAATHRLRFNAYASAVDKTLDIGYFDVPNDASTFVIVQSVVLPGTAAATTQEFTILPTGVPAGVERLVFRNSPTTTNVTMYIDDVVWEPIPSCPDMTGLTAGNTLSTTIDLTWQPGDSVTAWQYVYGATTVTDPNTLPIFNVANNPETTVVGLAPSTTYKIWIRSNCGVDGFGIWSDPITVTTTCTPVAVFSENFDALTTGTSAPMPTCWTKFGTTGAVYPQTGGALPGTPPNRLYMNTSATTRAIAVLPPVSNLQAETHRLKFKAYATAASKVLEVGYFENSSDVATFVLLESFNMPSTAASTAQEFIMTPVGVSPEVESLVFRVMGSATTIYIDDVVWETIPACFDILEMGVSNLTNISTDLNWVPGGSESAWQYVYGLSSVTDPTTLTPENVTNNPMASISGLTANTTYKFWIRSNCGNGDFGNWSVPYTFTTSCDGVTTFSEDFDSYTSTGSGTPMPTCWRRAGNALTYITTGGAAPGTAPNRLYMTGNASPTAPTESLAIMPPLSNLQAGTHRLKFTAYASTLNKFLEVGYMGDPADITTFIVLETLNLPGTAAANAEIYSIIPQAVPAGITTLAFRNPGASGVATVLYIDNVVWETAPTCPDVNGLTFNGATNTAAYISWNPGGSETVWEYAYGATTVTDPNTLTAYEVMNVPSTTIPSLSPSTTYKVWVRSKCGTDIGVWSLPMTFITACVPVTTIPYTENFATFMPVCWSRTASGTVATGPIGSADGIWVADGFLNSGTTGAVKVNLYSLNRTGWLISPIIDLSANAGHTLTFNYAVTDWNDTFASPMGSDDTVKFVMSVDNGATWSEVVSFDASSNVPPTSQTYTYEITSTTPTARFAFIANDGSVDDAEDYDFFIDNFGISVSLGAPGFENGTFTAYPNPVKDILNLSYTENISSVAVFNLLGQQVFVKSLDANQAKIDMSHLSSGTYLVKVMAEGQIKTFKIIKE